MRSKGLAVNRDSRETRKKKKYLGTNSNASAYKKRGQKAT